METLANPAIDNADRSAVSRSVLRSEDTRPDGWVLEAIRRKERSERILASEGVPVNPDLPLTGLSGPILFPDTRQIAMRALCVLMTAIKAERMEQLMVLRVVRQYGLAGHFSPDEKEFIRNSDPTQEDRARFKWRFEAAWVLLWALGYVEKLQIPTSTCDVTFAIAIMRERRTSTFISDAVLRSPGQILDQADLIYRYQRAMEGVAQADRVKPAVALKPRVILERVHALSWLVRNSEEEWDQVTGDL